MQPSQGTKSRQSGEKRQVRGRLNQRPVPGDLNQHLYSKRMQVYAYTCTSVVLVGMLLGTGYLYQVEKVSASDSVLMFILGQVLGAWVALTNKIFRITAPAISQDN
jgi:hypothetical protein